MLDDRLMVQWRRNSNNFMEKISRAAFMESKDKFHNFEFVGPSKSKAAPMRRSPAGMARKGPVARAGLGVDRIEREAFGRASPSPDQYLATAGARRGPLQERCRRPILSAKPNSALMEQRP